MYYYVFTGRMTLNSVYLKTKDKIDNAPLIGVGIACYVNDTGLSVFIDHDLYYAATEITEEVYILGSIAKEMDYILKKKDCECGVDKTGCGRHSDYCPKYNGDE
jgi:hypothetical protein